MSRISDYDDYEANWQLHQGRWDRNLRATIASKRGQAALRELRDALLALPEPRLAYETFCRTDEDSGRLEVCAVGALAHHRGVTAPDWMNDPDKAYAEATAEWAAENLGLRMTLAWNLVYQNDEVGDGHLESPERRHARILAWLNENIRDDAAVSA